MSDPSTQREINSLEKTLKDADYDLSQQQSYNDITKAFFIFVEGFVVDAVAYSHNYRVVLDNSLGIVNATLAVNSSLNLVGARATTSINVGNRVVCAWKPGQDIASIVGVLPLQTSDPTHPVSDVVVPGSNVGLNVDAYTQGLSAVLTDEETEEEDITDDEEDITYDEDEEANLSITAADPNGGGAKISLEPPANNKVVTDKSGLIENSAGRPFDSIAVGDSGTFAETGLAQHIDPFLNYQRVNEETGVFGFYADNLLRVTGHNLELTSSGTERQDSNDRSRLSSEEGFSPYLHEVSGVADKCVKAFIERDAETVQNNEQYYYYIEPLHDDQQPFYRFQVQRGYLGGSGERKTLATWPEDYEGPLRYSEDVKMLGLFDSQVLGSGRYYVRSASGLIIAKNPKIIVPKRKKPALTDQGLEPSKRLRSSLSYNIDFGSGSCGGTSTTDSGSGSGVLEPPPCPPLHRASVAIDQMVYSINYEALQPFWDQPDSWYVPEEAEYLVYDEVPNFDFLISSNCLPEPEPVTVEIEGRYGKAKYYPNNSYMIFMDDGSIVLVDGWGSEIKMTGGNIYQSCANNLFQMPGKNVNIMAGYDVTVRAQNSVDVSASHSDVRVKAEKNLMLLGGNENCGGVLIESKTPSPSYDFESMGELATVTGIVMKSTKGQIVTLARDIFMSSELFLFDDSFQRKVYEPESSCGSGSYTGSGSGSGPDMPPVQFIVNTGLEGKIKMIGKGIERNAHSYMLDLVNDQIAMQISTWSIYIGMEVGVMGGILATDCICTNDWFYAAKHIATGDAQDNKCAVLDRSPDPIERAADRLGNSINKTRDYWRKHGEDGLKDHIKKAVGDVKDATFSFRTSEDYMSNDFVLYENRWQQMARESGQTLSTWKEKGVRVHSSCTYPYPGLEAWAVATSGMYSLLKLQDDFNGHAPNRNYADYETNGFKHPEKYVLDGNYVIIYSAAHKV